MKYLKSFKFWVAFFVVLYTFVGFIILPWFITDKIPLILKDKIGLNISIKKASFNPYTFELSLNDILVKDLNKRPVFKLKKFYIDYTIFGLLSKTFLFSNISIDSPKLFATINQDGNLNLANILPKSKKSNQADASSKKQLPGIMLRVINIKNGQIFIKDLRANKNFQANLGPYNFMAHDISTGKGELNAYTFKTLINGESKLSWKGGMSINPLKLYGKISLKDLRLPKLYKYAIPNITASLEKGSLQMVLPYQIDFSKTLQLKIIDARLKLENINLKSKKTGKNLIDAKSISMNDFNLDWPKKSILIDSFDIKGADIYSKLEKNGTIDLTKAFEIKSKNTNSTPSTKSPSKAWTYLLKNANVDSSSLYFTNLNLKKPTSSKLNQISIHVKNISSNTSTPIGYKISSKLNEHSSISILGSVIQKPLSTTSNIKLSNILLTDFINYIEPYINFKIKNASIDTAVSIDAKLGKQKDMTLKADTSISGLILNTKDDKKLIKWKKFSVNGLNLEWPKRSVVINSISLNDTFINAQLEKNGDINLIKSFVPKTKSPIKSKTQKSKPWRYLVKDAKIETAQVAFLDKTLSKPTKSRLSKISIIVKNISSNKKRPIAYKISSTLNAKSQIKLSGKVVQKPLSVTSKIGLANIKVEDFKNYLEPYINVDIKKAGINLNANLLAKLDKVPKIKLQATTSINNLAINSANDQKLLRWKKLLISGVKFQNIPMKIDIKKIKLEKPFIRAHIAKNHSTNFSNLVKEQKKGSAKSEPTELKIGSIELVNGTTDFSDASLPFPFKTLIHDLNGDITTLDFSSTTPSKIKLDGKIDKYGYANIKGVLLPFRIKQKADIDVLLKNLNLTSLTPYSGKFLGYKIKNGKLSMDLNYKISKSSLIGKNKINIDTLDLGDTVKSKDAVNLPLKLALALLKDSNGQINIDLPVQGDMNNPDFSYGGIVWRAVGNMITGLVTAPFRFLGSLLGVKADDLKAIDFEKGSAVIISTEVEKLVNLNKILSKRPGIKLEIIGGWDKVFDTKELQKQEFEKTIKIQLAKIKKDSNTTQIDNYGKALKILYTKSFSSKKYQELKKKFTTILKVDDNTTKKSKSVKNKKQEAKKPKVFLDLVALNTQMQKELTNAIKIDQKSLENLANERANAIKNALLNKYKIDAKRVKVSAPKSSTAKRDRWIESELKISL